MIEQERLGDALGEVDQIVAAADMGQLVSGRAPTAAAACRSGRKAGSKMTGRSTPTTDGTLIQSARARRTDRVTPSWRARVCVRPGQGASIGEVRPSSRRRCSQPPIRQKESPATPTSQATTTQAKGVGTTDDANSEFVGCGVLDSAAAVSFARASAAEGLASATGPR